MYFVYVLISLSDFNFYIGFTTNVEIRVKEHSKGGVPSTKNRRPFKLLLYEAYENKQDALRRERYFKTNEGKKTLKMMLREALKDFPR